MGRKDLVDKLVQIADDAGFTSRLNDKRHAMLDSLFQENK